MRDYNRKVTSQVREAYSAHQNNNSILGRHNYRIYCPIWAFEIFISNKSSILEDFNIFLLQNFLSCLEFIFVCENFNICENNNNLISVKAAKALLWYLLLLLLLLLPWSNNKGGKEEWPHLRYHSLLFCAF
jgi:hypothetical protein